MAKKYLVKPLGEDKVLQAYPLAQSASPQLTLDQWLDYIKTLGRDTDDDPPQAGVMSAQNAEGYIYGLYCHAVENDIKHGKVLKVCNFVAANLYDSKSLVDGMIDSMAVVAQDHGCVAVHVDLPEASPGKPQPVDGVVSLFKGAGYRVESVAMIRPVRKD